MGGVKATSENPRPVKDWTVKIFLLCFTIGVCLGMGEIIVRGLVGDIVSPLVTTQMRSMAISSCAG